MSRDDRRVVEGFKLPSTGRIIANEYAWIEMLRLVVGDDLPPPPSEAIQAYQKALTRR